MCLPLAGLVYLQSLVVSGEYVLPTDDVRRYAEYVTSARFHFSTLIDALGTTLLLIGLIALYAYLANSYGERWALAGLVLWCAYAAASPYHTEGVDISAIPAAERYLGGQQDALESVLWALNPGNFPRPIVVSGGVLTGLFPIFSNLFLGIAIWRSGTLPQGAAILWIGASVLGLVSGSTLALFGWIEALVVALDLGGSGWIAWSVWQQPLDRKPGLT